MSELKINDHKSKEKAIQYLYLDWLAYKKDYKDNLNCNMQESFIEYLERELDHYLPSDDEIQEFQEELSKCSYKDNFEEKNNEQSRMGTKTRTNN